ncbi:MAG TPA: cytochrome c3 family protein [Opitutaceae bacterium]|nr:cytochrome c3 family protein [Opitutaceae bacterium]
MARFFQLPNFKRDDYQRPNQKWGCGRACDGKGCQFGPDAKGVCHTTGECRPARVGDRWTCTRPDTSGGPCASGPLPSGECCRQIGPCQPVLSLRARRGRWSWAAGGLTVAILLVLGGADRERWADPGPLSSAHALSNARCSDCHQAPPAGPGGPGAFAGGFAGAFSGGRHPTGVSCLKCHDMGEHPMEPHGLDRISLTRAENTVKPGAKGASHSIVLAMARIVSPSDASRECIVCHTEHHGRIGKVTAFSDKQCQVCHVAAFDSFSKGHPEFSNYPFDRRTRLVFDHAKHLGEHFSDKTVAALAPKSCDACHVASTSGGFMVVRSFEKTCAACHGTQIEGEGRAGDKGIAFLRIPGLDAATLDSKGHGVGEWPSDADGAITPFTRLLLSKDKAASQAMAALSGVDLTDLRGASDERLAAAQALAWSIKSLFADLVTSGQDAMIAKLGDIDPAAERGQLRAMTAQMPRDGLLSAQTAWFPSLFTEVANYRAGVMPVSKMAPAASAASPAAAPHSAVVPGDGDLLDDKSPVAAPAKPKAAGDDILGDDLAADAKPAPKPVAKAAGDDLLGDDATPAAKPTSKPAPKAAKDSGDDLIGDDAAPAPKVAAAAPAPTKKIEPLKVNDAEAWTPAGGWYRSADNPTLYYRPVGHADAFLTLWLSASAKLSSGPHGSVAEPLFLALSDAKGPGLCMKCHSVDRVSGGEKVVNWSAAGPHPTVHEITKFNHEAHFSLMDQKGCQTCHQMKAQSAYLTSFGDNLDPAHFESGFGPVVKASCAACHNDKVAGQSCQLCHSYHVGEVTAKISGTGQMKPLE